MTLGVNPDPPRRLPLAEPNAAFILAVIDNSVFRQAFVMRRVGAVAHGLLAQRAARDQDKIVYQIGNAAGWRNWNSLSDAAVKRLLSLKQSEWLPSGGWIGPLSPLVAGMALEVEKTGPDEASPAG